MFSQSNCIELKECVACGSHDLVPVLDLGYQPLANSYRKNLNDSEETYPLAINRCNHCYHVQLTHQVNPEIMFKDYAYVSGTAKTQLDYFDWFVSQINKSIKSVLDIGCNDGSLLNAWIGTGVETYGVDPAENLHPISSKNHNTHCGFFTGKEFGDKKFDVITCFNAFAHNANQLELLKNIKKVMNDDAMVYCSISQAHMILNGEFDTIYHEHLSFYNIRSANELCKRAGLYLVDVIKHSIHGQTYIFVISNKPAQNDYVDKLIAEEHILGLYDPETYKEYANKSKKVADKFKESLTHYRNEGYKIIGYGAPAKGNVMMNFAGIGPDFTIDDSPFKQGLYTPGIDVLIRDAKVFDEIYNIDRVVFVPLAWNFYDEIVGKIKRMRPNNKDIFIRYFPEFTIYND